MDYFKILNLRTEPFSNSPDPAFFYRSDEHIACLQKLELAVRLRRGLNVIIGDIGTGKTTLSRQFILQHKDDDNLQVHLVLDPSFNTPMDFLAHISGLFGLQPADSEWQYKENIKNFLFKQGVDEGKTIIVVIDEGQKIPEFCLEILREFMNFETNEFKLLQVIIFAQNEFREIMDKYPNFADRVNICAYLNPLSFKETKALINYRLEQASEGRRAASLFTLPAYWSVFKLSGGRPRKIIQLCHKLLLSMIIQNRSRINSAMVKACFHSTELPKAGRNKWAAALIGVAAVVFAVVFTLNFDWKKNSVTPAKVQETPQPAASVSVKQTEAVSISEPEKSVNVKPVKVRGGLLGKITISRGETLNSLLSSVYGITSGRILRTFSEANPGVRNYNMIIAGEELRFPLYPVSASEAVYSLFWVKYGSSATLEQAYAELKNLRRSGLAVKLVSSSDRSGNLTFALLGETGYKEKDAAGNKLKSSGISGSSIIKLDRNKTYYSYMGG